MLYQQPDEISVGSDRPQTSSPEANSVEGPVSVHSDGPEANAVERHVAVHGDGPEGNHIEGPVVPADGPDANVVEEGPVVPEANAVGGAVVPADDPEANPVVPADGPDANAVDGQVAPVPPLDGDERTIFFFHKRILRPDEGPSRLIPVYQMIGPSGHLMGKFDRSLLEDHHRLKYELKILAMKRSLRGAHRIQFSMWPERGENGYATAAFVFIRRPLVQLTVEAVYVSKIATGAAFEGGDEEEPFEDEDEEEMDVSEGWYEDDNTRTGSDIMSFDDTEAIPVIECVVGVMNPRVQCVGYVFGKHCHDYDTLRLQLLFCGRRAQLVGKYKIEFIQKGKEPADITDAKVTEEKFDPPKENKEEFQKFAQQLKGIILKPVRAEEPEGEGDVITFVMEENDNHVVGNANVGVGEEGANGANDPLVEDTTKGGQLMDGEQASTKSAVEEDAKEKAVGNVEGACI